MTGDPYNRRHGVARLMLARGVFVVFAGACALSARPNLSPEKMSEFWEEPVDLEKRDLFYGPGGPVNAPDPDDKYKFKELKSVGYNPGYDVEDQRDRDWSVKLGVESRVEVTMSRLLWAVGYHQPHNYYLPRWTMTRDGRDTVLAGVGSRFRLELKTEKKEGEWAWRKNAFLETRPFAGLTVLMVMINNWDIKTAQNAVYEIAQDGGDPATHYMVRDLGAALGKTGWLTFGTKDDLDDFEKEPFIDRVEGNRVYFHYQGATMEPHLLNGITPRDVRWICGLMSRLSDKQWSDAFRAGGYTEAEAARLIKRLKEKVDEGLGLPRY